MIDIKHQQLTEVFENGKTTLDNGQVAVRKAFMERERDSYGDYMQYGDDDCYVVFEVDGKFYKQWGSQSSYGIVYWDGGLSEVQPKTKIVEVWD